MLNMVIDIINIILLGARFERACEWSGDGA